MFAVINNTQDELFLIELVKAITTETHLINRKDNYSTPICIDKHITTANTNMRQPYDTVKLDQVRKSLKTVIKEMCKPEKDIGHCKRLSDLITNTAGASSFLSIE